MSEQPNFGPYSSWENIVTFSEISERAFALFNARVKENWKLLSRPVHHLFLRMAYQAETTSFGIRLNNSWALCLPALTMTRIRLEQTIVCSYLIHEEEALGLMPFVRYISIGQYSGLQVAMQNDSLAKELPGTIDIAGLRAEAAKAQEWFAPGFSIENDKFERKWTKLDLRTMVKKRDALAKTSSAEPMLKHSLEREYVSIYKVASSVVHADASSLSYSFLNLFPSPSGEPVLMALPSWAMIVAASTAHYDILQCYEILDWFDIQANREYTEFMKEWIEARDEYVK